MPGIWKLDVEKNDRMGTRSQAAVILFSLRRSRINIMIQITSDTAEPEVVARPIGNREEGKWAEAR